MMSNFYEKISALASGGWSWCCHGLDAYSIIRNSFMAATLAFVCFAWWAKVFTKTKPTLPPGPRGLPIVGNLPFIKPDLHRYFLELSQIYGPIVKLQLGRKIWIVITSPSLAKEILKDQDAIFANRDTPAAAVLGSFGGVDIVWRPNGPDFRRLRKLVVHEIMSNRGLDACYAIRQREVRQMVKNIYGKVGSSVDLGEQMFLTTLNIMISLLWGGSLEGEEGSSAAIEVRKKLQEFVGLIGAPNVSDIFPVLAPFDLQRIQSKTQKHLSWFYEMFESVIVNRTKQTIREGKKKEEISMDFLQQLLEQNQQGEDKISITEIKALLMDMMVGGMDTIPNTVVWAMTELLRYPEIMRKVIEELEAVVGNENNVEESHLPRLHYLEAVVKETLRIHPVAPLLVPHMPSKTCTIAGYTIPKHSNIFINTWAIQRDPKFWENPLQFQPERFLMKGDNGGSEKDYNYTGNNFHFFPFGSGRRICVGLPLAEKMVPHLLAVLVHSFEWKLPDGIKPDTKEKLRFVLAKADPLVVIPLPRLSTSLQYQ